MVYNFKHATYSIPQSSTSSCTELFQEASKCGPNHCQHCCSHALLNDYTYSVLKKICRKIIRDLNRQKCREKYTIFEGGNGVNVRIHRSLSTRDKSHRNSKLEETLPDSKLEKIRKSVNGKCISPCECREMRKHFDGFASEKIALRIPHSIGKRKTKGKRKSFGEDGNQHEQITKNRYIEKFKSKKTYGDLDKDNDLEMERKVRKSKGKRSTMDNKYVEEETQLRKSKSKCNPKHDEENESQIRKYNTQLKENLGNEHGFRTNRSISTNKPKGGNDDKEFLSSKSMSKGGNDDYFRSKSKSKHDDHRFGETKSTHKVKGSNAGDRKKDSNNDDMLQPSKTKTSRDENNEKYRFSRTKSKLKVKGSNDFQSSKSKGKGEISYDKLQSSKSKLKSDEYNDAHRLGKNRAKPKATGRNSGDEFQPKHKRKTRDNFSDNRLISDLRTKVRNGQEVAPTMNEGFTEIRKIQRKPAKHLLGEAYNKKSHNKIKGTSKTSLNGYPPISKDGKELFNGIENSGNKEIALNLKVGQDVKGTKNAYMNDARRLLKPSRYDEAKTCDFLRANMEQRELRYLCCTDCSPLKVKNARVHS